MNNDHINENPKPGLDDPATLAKPLAQVLDAHAQQLDMRVLTRLEQSRQHAVTQHARLTNTLQPQRDGTMASVWSWGQHRGTMLAGLLSLALLAGLMLAQHYERHQQQGDAFLLGAELPPEAFVDRGFEPWLNANSEF